MRAVSHVPQGNVCATCSEILIFFLFFQVEFLLSLRMISCIQVRCSSQQMLGMSVLRIEELHAQLIHFEYVIWLLAHITGFLFCLHGYKSMC